jgi:transcriptional regulator with XRE-family HTH domain
MESIHPLKSFRENHDPKLSQDQLADLLGVSRVTVTRWESGARKLGPELLQLVSERTGIAPADLRPDLADLLRHQDPESSLSPADVSRGNPIGSIT